MKKPKKTSKLGARGVDARLDAATVDRIIKEVEEAVAAGRGRVTYPRKGRPSLTGKPSVSPTVGFRVTPELRRKAERLAKRRGTSVSALARQALEEYLQKAG